MINWKIVILSKAKGSGDQKPDQITKLEPADEVAVEIHGGRG